MDNGWILISLKEAATCGLIRLKPRFAVDGGGRVISGTVYCMFFVLNRDNTPHRAEHDVCEVPGRLQLSYCFCKGRLVLCKAVLGNGVLLELPVKDTVVALKD